MASYFVCYTSRSGSTLLCDALTSTGVAGRPEEYFHPGATATLGKPAWREDWATKDFKSTLRELLRYGTTPNGIFGSKLLLEESADIGDRLRRLFGVQDSNTARVFANTFPQPRYLWMTRRDKVRQAISLFRAKQSGEWIRKVEGGPAASKLVFSYRLIDGLLRHIVHTESAWARYFIDSGIVPHTVVYEDLVQTYEPTVREVLKYLQISLPEGFVFPPPTIQRQSDELTEEWVQRFYKIDRVKRQNQRISALPEVLYSSSLRRRYLGHRLETLLAQYLDKRPTSRS